IGRVAAGTRDGSESAGLSLELLHEVRPEAAPAKGLLDGHVDVAIRRVVVEQDASLADRLSVQFQQPLATALPARDGVLDLLRGCDQPERGSVGAMRSSGAIFEDNAFALDVLPVGVDQRA